MEPMSDRRPISGEPAADSARLSRIPSLWVEGSHEIESTAFVVFPKLLLEIASGFLFSSPARAGQPSSGQTNGQPTEHAQNGQASGRASPAAIFIEGGIQPLVEDSFNAPIIPPALEQFPGFPDFWIGTGDHRPSLAGGFALLHGPALKLADLGCGHKADLLRSRILEPQLPAFLTSPVDLPSLGDLRRIPRGEKRGTEEARARSCAAFPGWLSP